MKDRRPRKLKKILKARKRKADTIAAVQAAASVAMSHVRALHILSVALPSHLKAVKMTETIINSAQSISQIMSATPKNWRDA